MFFFFFFVNDTATSEIYTLSLHDALPILQLVNWEVERMWADREFLKVVIPQALLDPTFGQVLNRIRPDRKSTRLNSSHRTISYAVFCLKKKTKNTSHPNIQINDNIILLLA